ncbi:MAG: hypothetical protein HY653_06465 [Acidobacteria bacterium]|nr:hypothetical protein [Acidobacteriota bacterium]
MSRRSNFLIAAAFVLFLAVIVYSTLRLNQVTVEVCMEFRGRTNCGTAAGTSEEEAIRTGVNNACALIAHGRTDAMACARGTPISIRRLDD